MRSLFKISGFKLDLTVDKMFTDEEYEGEGTWTFNRAQLRRYLKPNACVVQTDGRGEEHITKLWEYLETEVDFPFIPEDPDIAGGMAVGVNSSRYLTGIDEDETVDLNATDEVIAILRYLRGVEPIDAIEVAFYGKAFWAFHDIQHSLDAVLDESGIHIELSAYAEDRAHTLGSMMGIHFGFVTPYDCFRCIVMNEKAFEDRFNTPSIALEDLCNLLDIRPPS